MSTIYELGKAITANAASKGFWNSDRPVIEDIDSSKANIVAEKLMLIVSECAEALEADRKQKFCKTEILNIVGLEDSDDILFKEVFEDLVKDTFEDELADIAIRLLDLAFKMGIDLESHIVAKMMYNSMREFKHGKKY